MVNFLSVWAQIRNIWQLLSYTSVVCLQPNTVWYTMRKTPNHAITTLFSLSVCHITLCFLFHHKKWMTNTPLHYGRWTFLVQPAIINIWRLSVCLPYLCYTVLYCIISMVAWHGLAITCWLRWSTLLLRAQPCTDSTVVVLSWMLCLLLPSILFFFFLAFAAKVARSVPYLSYFLPYWSICVSQQARKERTILTEMQAKTVLLMIMDNYWFNKKQEQHLSNIGPRSLTCILQKGGKNENKIQGLSLPHSIVSMLLSCVTASLSPRGGYYVPYVWKKWKRRNQIRSDYFIPNTFKRGIRVFFTETSKDLSLSAYNERESRLLEGLLCRNGSKERTVYCAVLSPGRIK